MYFMDSLSDDDDEDSINSSIIFLNL
jgi:hypothetical protein